MSINTSDTTSYPSNAEEDNFEINLNIIDTEQVLITNKTPQPNQTRANFALDSGSTKHVITNKEFFITYKDFRARLGWGTDASIKYIGIKNVKLVNKKNNKLVLENYLYAPNFKYNLITISRLDKLSYKIRVKDNQAHIYKNKQLLMTAIGRDNLYYIDTIKNNLRSKKTNKVKKTNKQINKIELTNKNNLLEQTKLWH
jgi:hypothetical protein